MVCQDDDDGEEVDVLLDDDEAANAYSKSGSQMKSLLEKSAKGMCSCCLCPGFVIRLCGTPTPFLHHLCTCS